MPRAPRKTKSAPVASAASAKSTIKRKSLDLETIITETEQRFNNLCDDMRFPIHKLDEVTSDSSREVWYAVRDLSLALHRGFITKTQFADAVFKAHEKELRSYYKEIKLLEKNYSTP